MPPSRFFCLFVFFCSFFAHYSYSASYSYGEGPSSQFKLKIRGTPLSRDHPLLTLPSDERDPTLVCKVIQEEIQDFPNKDQSQKEESLLLIQELLDPLVDSSRPPGDDDHEDVELLVGEQSLPLRQVLSRGPNSDQERDDIVYPMDEAEVQQLVKDALAKHQIIRVIGAGHSVSAAISDPTTDVLVNLRNLRSIKITPANGSSPAQVTVGGGCHLRQDLGDPTSTIENSLLHNLNEAGYAFPILGGIAHQTVAGFLSTGSAGGSVQEGLHNHVIMLRFVNGLGEIVELTRSSNNPEFFAAGVSLGLFGILVSATFTLVPDFFIEGTQTTSPLTPINSNPSLGCPIDVLGPGTSDVPSMEAHLNNTQYTRMLWWPQEGLKRLTIWNAESIPVIDPATGQQWEVDEYEELPRIGGSSIPSQITARTILQALNLMEADNPIYKELAATLLGLFNPITEGGMEGAQVFRDWWWRGLPMDNEISDNIMPVSFTEMWFPLSQAQEVMNELNDLFENDFTTHGNFFTEIYAAKESPFWLSPSFEQDMIRVNVNWFTANPRGSPEEFYKPYWEKFEKRGFRCHWGKYTPDDYGNTIKQRYNRYDDWMKVREKMDPNQIFVTPYWRSRLAIPSLN